jgi:hypothetical protein
MNQNNNPNNPSGNNRPQGERQNPQSGQQKNDPQKPQPGQQNKPYEQPKGQGSSPSNSR